MATDTTKPKRGRGRPPKDPNDTTTAPYVKKNPYSGKGRPKNNPYEGSGWGGVREGAGRPKSVEEKDKLSYNIAFSCNAITKERYRRLQEVCNISDLLRQYISRLASTRLGPNNVPDTWLPPKKKA
jgi:hypothetical protein